MNKFTSGPWFLDKEDEFTVRTDGENGKMMWIVDIYPDADLTSEKGMKERAANARLISCAPEMLEALVSIYGLANLEPLLRTKYSAALVHDIMQGLADVIAKARGTTPNGGGEA